MLNCSRDRGVCAPQSLSAGTWTEPRLSFSTRVASIAAPFVDLTWTRVGATVQVHTRRVKGQHKRKQQLCREERNGKSDATAALKNTRRVVPVTFALPDRLIRSHQTEPSA